MIILKEVKHYPDTNSVEAVWVDRTPLPDIEVPATDAVLNEAGEVITPAVAAHTITEQFEEVTVKCHSYADVQMGMLRADLGADAAQYVDLIALVESNIKPPTPISPEERWAQIKAKRDDLTDNGGCFVSGKWYHSDAKAKQQQMALAMVGASLPAIQWKTMDGSFVTLTPALVGQVFQAQMAREQAIFAHAEMLNATPVADIDTGWPARYESV